MRQSILQGMIVFFVLPLIAMETSEPIQVPELAPEVCELANLKAFKAKIEPLRDDTFLYDAHHAIDANTSLKKFQQQLWQLKQCYKKEFKKARVALMPKTVYEAVRSYAERQPKNYTIKTIQTIIANQRKAKDTNNYYISVPLDYYCKGKSYNRYLIHDFEGNHAVYEKKVKSISPLIQDMVTKVLKLDGGHLCGVQVPVTYHNGGYVYTAGTQIEVYVNQLGLLLARDILAIINPTLFLEHMDRGAKLAKTEMQLAEYKVTKAFVSHVLKKYPETFYEAWTHIRDMKNKKAKKEVEDMCIYEVNEKFYDTDKKEETVAIEEFYVIKEAELKKEQKKTQQMTSVYGVLFDDENDDGEIVIGVANNKYKVADEIVRYCLEEIKEDLQEKKKEATSEKPTSPGKRLSKPE